MTLAAGLGRRAALGGAFALAGCSLLPTASYVQRTQWPLVVSRAQALPPRRRGKILLVREIVPAPGLDQQGVQWLLPNGSVHVDFYNLWTVTPAQAVTDDLRRWLASSGLFGAVVGSASGLTPDLVLEGELTALIADPQRRTGRLALSLMLLDQHRVPLRILSQRTISATARMPSDTPAGVVAAQRDALAEALRRVEIWLGPNVVS